MASFRDGMRKLAYRARAIPGKLGFRPYTVAVEVKTWPGDRTGQGTPTVTTTAITEANGQPPKVRWLSNEEIVVAGYDRMTAEIGPITPDFPGGGTTLATLKGKNAPAKSEVFVVLTGPDFPSGARFTIVGDNSDRALRYMLRVQRAADS